MSATLLKIIRMKLFYRFKVTSEMQNEYSACTLQLILQLNLQSIFLLFFGTVKKDAI